MKIPLSNPDITQKEIDAVVSVLKTPNLSLGPKLPEFEKKFANYIGTKHAIAVNSGTSALHLCVKALGIKSGDEVITTPFSFIASANCILFEQAKPIFVDIKEATLNIDENKIEEKITKKTKAILPVHVFGYPCNMEKIKRIAKKYKLAVIEDSCEAIGAEIKGEKIGTFGNAAVFAFYPNKQMTTGEGGIIATNDDEIARLSKSMRNQGRDENAEWLEHNRLGYNYRISDINCALGIAQLERIDDLLSKRSKVAELYSKPLSGISEIILPPEDSGNMKRSWFVYVIRLKEMFSELQRNNIIKGLRGKGISCSAYFPPIHLQPFYRKQFGFKNNDFPITEKIAKRTIALPFYNKLSGTQISYIGNQLRNILKKREN
ncbi:polysaccharide biosynthesis protein [candidate division WOR-1 bacterium RIFOXYC2_FULL_37_10]|uniref:Polysaccharide biosynthesis protein n=1 Tax=candidate division WOR-1 bacterium RIFOXYB2_FULL_37_13 TaxID=1802579 RepID=A0A1F4SSG9_UNCSA|nr:MAG: polysaccharide biosynthesis protein [candidate division WOR-1 bacterium RIFOXYA2_FULL_37_7]OGC22623.1 MAG: polysaccharide biosynthesis protein [candidate division WOR-1 bacterium RIFOXYB2_FULL_37_13]OGC34249.1 MAG: polysaccharide biosynthesis protein [candidate division WOR-1 bacterium RIFOXYC2_FULL_37_10]